MAPCKATTVVVVAVVVVVVVAVVVDVVVAVADVAMATKNIKSYCLLGHKNVPANSRNWGGCPGAGH